jgi:hypothetical protein
LALFEAVEREQMKRGASQFWREPRIAERCEERSNPAFCLFSIVNT